MGDLRALLTRLRALTPELNAATDRATKLVLAVEHFLNEECRLHLPTYVSLSTGGSHNGEWDEGIRLEYGRWEGKFRLLVADYTEHEADPDGPRITERMPWANATRDRKLSTIDLIPTLLDRIAERVDSTIKDANATAAKVENYLSDLGLDLTEGK